MSKAANEAITRVYTFAGGGKMIKIQVIGKSDECLIANATKTEESEDGELVLKNDKNEIIGKFQRSQVIGWWST